jgi:hypothetical protein
MGAMLDQARLLALRASPCTSCGGHVAKRQAGRGTVWASRGEARERALAHERLVAEFFGQDPDDIDPEDLDPGLYGKTCPDCDGRGWVVDSRRNHQPRAPEPRPGEPLWAEGAVRQLLTAQPTGSSQEPSTTRDEVADHETLALLGAVSRRLLAIGERHADVLRAFYLPTPVRESPRAVWPLTPAGRTLLRSSAPGVGPWQAIEALLAEQDARPTARRRAQFEAANAQAERLLAAATAAWFAVVSADVEALVDELLEGS